MPNYLTALALGMVLTRVFIMRTRSIEAVKFGERDRTDFLIPPSRCVLLGVSALVRASMIGFCLMYY